MFYHGMDENGDAKKIEHTRRVRSTVMTRVIERPGPNTTSTSSTKDTSAISTRPSRTRYNGGFETRRAQSSSPAPRDVTPVMDVDLPTDENKPPYHSDLKRAQSEGDLLDGDIKHGKLMKIRSFPSLERRVRFKPREDYNMQSDLHDNKRRSKSYDELSWKKPSIEVKRKVQLLPQKETTRRARSVSSLLIFIFVKVTL